MKYFILAVAFLSMAFTNAFAGANTKAENDAAMAAGRRQIAAKTVELEKNFGNHNNVAAQAAANDVLALMWQGYRQTNLSVRFETPAQQKAAHDRALNLEKIAHEYQELSSNVAANGTKMIQFAKSYMQQY